MNPGTRRRQHHRGQERHGRSPSSRAREDSRSRCPSASRKPACWSASQTGARFAPADSVDPGAGAASATAPPTRASRRPTGRARARLRRRQQRLGAGTPPGATAARASGPASASSDSGIEGGQGGQHQGDQGQRRQHGHQQPVRAAGSPIGSRRAPQPTQTDRACETADHEEQRHHLGTRSAAGTRPRRIVAYSGRRRRG